MSARLNVLASRLFCCFFLLVLCTPFATAEDKLSREEKVRRDKERVESEGFWLYNDLEGAFEKAKQTGKPILVVLRCLPCEECVKLDDELIDNEPRIRSLLEQFVCVRVVGTNGLDLDTFQYDTDQSFAVFMLNADKTIYGRFGTRSHRTDWIGDVSIDGMAAAMEGALELHADYPSNASALKGKRGKPLEFPAPEKFPNLAKKFKDTLDYEGDVVASCIHCHQIGEARREYYWQSEQQIPEKLLFPFPHPKSIGLILDPKSRGRVSSVVDDSPASEAGLREDDDIISINSQPILSMADIQWILEETPAKGAELLLRIQREDRPVDLTLSLPSSWRQRDDISWRVTSWTLCRMFAGGMRFQPLNEEERASSGISSGMAFRVKNIGRYGAHGLARRKGFRQDDIVVSYGGHNSLARESDLFAFANSNFHAGDVVEIEVLRDGKKQTFKLPMQP